MRLLLCILALFGAAAPCAAGRQPTSVSYASGVIEYAAPAASLVSVTKLGTRTGTNRDTLNLSITVPEDSSLVVVAMSSKMTGGMYYMETVTMDGSVSPGRGGGEDSGEGRAFLFGFRDVAAGAHTIQATAYGAVSYSAMVVASFSGVRDTISAGGPTVDGSGYGTGTAASTGEVGPIPVAHNLLVGGLGFVGNDASAVWGGGFAVVDSAGIGSTTNAAKIQLGYTVVNSTDSVAGAATLWVSRAWGMVLMALRAIP